MPTVVERRESLAGAEQAELHVQLLQVPGTDERSLADRRVPPEAGVYTSTDPTRRLNDRPLIKPSNNVIPKVETTPERESAMGAEKTLYGLLRYSYDGAAGSHSVPS